MRLVVVSHVLHRRSPFGVLAYGPYAAEIDEWARMFDEVVVVAPESDNGEAGSLRLFRGGNIRLSGLRKAGGPGIGGKAGLLAALPGWAWVIWRELQSADLVQVRCPGNVGLVGAVLAPLAGRPMIAKYAGQWSRYPGEPWSFRLQRWILRHFWKEGAVLVYSDRKEAAHLFPVYNSALSREHLRRAAASALRPRARGRLLFVGRLTEAKGVQYLLEACARLRRHGIPVQLDVAGEGEARDRLERLAERSDLPATFHGGLELEALLELYEQADVLALPSRTEGWPKVLVEAMAFGVPCVATTGGLNDWMLSEGRGLTTPYGDVDALASALRLLIDEEEKEKTERRRRCAAFGHQYSIEGVAEIFRSVLRERWPWLMGDAPRAMTTAESSPR